MYRVVKEEGLYQQVFLITDDSQIMLGKGVAGRVADIIIENSELTFDDLPAITDNWDIEVNKETAIALTRLTTPTGRPVRTNININKTDNKPKKELTEEEKKIEQNKNIDLFDVLYDKTDYII